MMGIKETAYAASHTFQFRLNQEFRYRNHSIDTIRIEIEWADADYADDPDDFDGQEGWLVYAYFYGWPTTKEGRRDKRVKDRERVSHLSGLNYPTGLRYELNAAWTEAHERSRINTEQVINFGEGLFSDRVWEGVA
jgi:hypothetical protein